MDKLIQILFAQLDKLTGRRLVLGAAAIAVGSSGIWFWENRATVMPLIIASPTALWTIGIVAAGISLWVVFSPKWERLERKGDALENFLRGELKDQRTQIQGLSSQNEKQASQIAEQGRQLNELTLRERACQRRLDRAETALRNLGELPPPRSDWSQQI